MLERLRREFWSDAGVGMRGIALDDAITVEVGTFGKVLKVCTVAQVMEHNDTFGCFLLVKGLLQWFALSSCLPLTEIRNSTLGLLFLIDPGGVITHSQDALEVRQKRLATGPVRLSQVITQRAVVLRGVTTP